MFGDGSLSVMELVRFFPHDQLHNPQAATWRWQELLRAHVWTPSEWMDVDTEFATHAFAGSRALAGETSAHGSIGWVALTRDDECTLEWLAVSCSSNPFAEVTLDETVVTAINTAGRIWTFPRNAPQQVEITEDPAYPWPRQGTSAATPVS